MPFYQKRGKIPDKKHTQFRDDDGNLYWEELISRGGFSHMYSTIYHTHPPTSITKLLSKRKIYELIDRDKTHMPYRLDTTRLISDSQKSKNVVDNRYPLFFNEDIVISYCLNLKNANSPYKNALADELLYIQEGSGMFISNFGSLEFKEGDYLVIPRGIIWKIKPETALNVLIIESNSPIETPERYRNKFGQLLEHSPFSERDIVTPQFPGQRLREADHERRFGRENVIDVKYDTIMQKYQYQHNLSDVIGWDGYYYPWKFNIKDFMPITGKIHQPPPVHQTFQSKGFVVCSFVPRLFDYHKEAIPAPYAHSNVDSEEIIFYSKGDFMSRKNIGEGDITYHPMGLTHGPQPGKIEESLGVKETDEYAVMIDTFKPLKMTTGTNRLEDGKYPFSWNTEKENQEPKDYDNSF